MSAWSVVVTPAGEEEATASPVAGSAATNMAIKILPIKTIVPA
jgi:hypothetical protein